jgi:glutaminyl-tRNA synthetase
VNGWDDPRMPTISGMRRRGYTPASIRAFAERVGVEKRDNVIDLGLLEFSVREDLNKVAQRRMAILNPLKVVITNFDDVSGAGAVSAVPAAGSVSTPPAAGSSTWNKMQGAGGEGFSGRVEMIKCVNNPEDESAGTREVPLTREIYIERTDFMEEPPKGFHRLRPGGEVRLRYAYLIRCDEVVRDPATNEIIELRCSYDPESAGGGSSDGRRVKGVIHWVSAPHAISGEARLYSTLFNKENPDDCSEGETFLSHLNPESLVVSPILMEPSLANTKIGETFQFERLGYFSKDSDSTPTKAIFNKTVGLKDSWAKQQS